jgi:heat shock protein HslJ
MSKMRLMLLFLLPLGLSVLVVGLVIGTTIGIDSCEFPPWVGLEGTWVLKCYGEPGKLRLPYPREIGYARDITLTLSARDYVITTWTGINRCEGNYEMDGNKFIIYTVNGGEKRTGGLICTEMGGPKHLIAQQNHYRDILTSAQTYEITNCILIISSGKEVLVFTRLESYEHAPRPGAPFPAKE